MLDELENSIVYPPPAFSPQAFATVGETVTGEPTRVGPMLRLKPFGPDGVRNVPRLVFFPYPT